MRSDTTSINKTPQCCPRAEVGARFLARACHPGRPRALVRGARVVVLAAAFLVCATAISWAADADTATVFESAYSDWIAYLGSPEFGPWSDDGHIVRNPQFERIAALGLPALPLIVAKMKEPGPPQFLVYAARAIARKAFPRAAFAGPAGWADHRQEAALWVQWLNGGPDAIASAFEQALGQWREAAVGDFVPLWTTETDYDRQMHDTCTMGRKLTPAGEAYQTILDHGVAVLPLLAERFRQGDYDFLPIAMSIAGGQPSTPSGKALPAKQRAEAFLAWWDQNKQDWLIPWPDAPAPEEPTAQP